MLNAKWIWYEENYTEDSYGEFSADFWATDEAKTVVQVACDGAYELRVNGELMSFSGCADYPALKYYNEVDVSSAVVPGDNEITVRVWYVGVDSQTYRKSGPGVIFEVFRDGKSVLASSENTPSRPLSGYRFGYKKLITIQLGPSFYFDNTVPEAVFSKSVPVEKTMNLKRRPISELELGGRLPISVTEKDNCLLIDMGRETAGFLELDLNSDGEQELLISYGEHLADGSVRRQIGGRDFSVEFKARSGHNAFLGPFRRIAGRFIEIHVQNPIYLNYAGLRPVNYPVKVIEKDFGDGLLNEIYKVSVDTLRLSMHEHYEDCPWREQALYTMDSRNQMLCGYYCFEGLNKEYARHNLSLISQGLMPCGLLDLCYPAGIGPAIPMFSLCYMLQIDEYVEHTGDMSIFAEAGPVLERIFKTFVSKIDETGLIPEFDLPSWNFYEWAPGSAGNMGVQNDRKIHSSILNLMFLLAVSRYLKYVNFVFDTEKFAENIIRAFKKDGLFVLSSEDSRSSQLSNSLACLCGLSGKDLALRMLSDKTIIEATLSMKAFYYDALIKNDLANEVILEIKKNYGYMLENGATSFWETIEGESAFDNAGSLCHGWSAIPVYYLSILC